MTLQTSLKLIVARARTVLQTSRAKRLGKWFAGFLLVFGLLGFFAAPPLLKSILLSQLSTELHRPVSIENIAVNPFALSARVNGFSVKAEGGREVLGFDELFVNLSSASLFKFAVVVDAVRLQGLRVSVVRQADGRYDISDLLDEWMKPKDEPDTGTPRFSVNNIRLIDGKIIFDDQPKGKVHTVSEINLGMPFLSSLPYQADLDVEPSFSAVVDGSKLVLKGRSKPFAGTRESELDLNVDHFDLAGLQAYLPANIPLRLNSGVLDSELKVVFKELSDQVFSLGVIGSAHVSGLSVAESNGQPLLGWKRLDIDLENADLINQKFAIKRLALDAPEISLSVNRQGDFNVLRLADKLSAPTAKSAKAKPVAPEPAARPLAWSLGELAVSHGLLHWKDDSRLTPVSGEVRDLHVLVGKVDSKLLEPIEIKEASYQIDLGERLRVEKMQIKGMRVDLPGHRIDIAEVNNSQTRARMLRTKEGLIEWVSSPVLRTIRATDAKVKDEKPWIGNVAKLNVEDLAFRFEDQSTRPNALQELEGFSLQAENLSNAANKQGKLVLQGKLNKQGRLKVDGSLQILPLNAALKIETQSIPVMPFEPYLRQFVNLDLKRGLLSNKGEATLLIDKNGVFKSSYQGSFTLGDFLAADLSNNADFLKWKSLYLGGIDFHLQPMAINVGEIALSDYYAKLILNQDGRLNVQDLVNKPASAVPPTPPLPASGPSTASQSAELTPVAPAKPPLPIKITKITLQNGTVNFSDFFVKPNYTVNVSKLGGRVTGLSSAADTVADLDLRGSYAKSSPVHIQGKLNPLAARSYLDLKADVTGVDLTGFSPYSGKYAGYNIDKGKLSLSLAYKLENNELSAENKLFIDQFTFGDKVDSPDATTLPVNLAISLLKNNRGEIDLNLPISGSLDDPQFSLGGLVIKVITNLFVKAVTSPFALLGSMFGDGEELSNVEFAPGRARVDEAAVKKLEILTKALTERSALKLEITGRADPVADREGLKQVAMERAMRAEKAKDLPKGDASGESLRGIVIAPEEYKTYLTRAYKAAKFPKPRNFIGMQKDLPVEEMEKLMLANMPAGEDDLKQLAKRRAENVQVWLIEQGKIPPERLFLVAPKADDELKGKLSRVDFSLR